MKTLHYTGEFKPSLLFDELVAVGVVPQRLECTPDLREVMIYVDEGIDVKAVEAVIGAHDAQVRTISEKAEDQRAEALRTLLRYDAVGLAQQIEGAESIEALHGSVIQLAHLVSALAALNHVDTVIVGKS